MSSSKLIAPIAVGCGVAGIAIIAACGGLLYLGYKTANTSVGPEIDRLFAAIDDGTFAETYETATSQEFRNATSKDQYAQIGKAVSTRLGRLKSKSLKSFNSLLDLFAFDPKLGEHFVDIHVKVNFR